MQFLTINYLAYIHCLIIIFSCIVLGMTSASKLPIEKWQSNAEFIAASVFLGIFLQSWVIFIFGLIFPLTLATYIAILPACGSYLLFAKPKIELTVRPSFLMKVSICVLVLIPLLLMSNVTLPAHDGWVWADNYHHVFHNITCHMMMITHMVDQNSTYPSLSMLSGHLINYHFLSSILSASLLSFKATIREAIFLPSLLLLFSTLILLYSLAQRITKSYCGGIITLVLFIFSGSFFTVVAVYKSFVEKRIDILTFFTQISKDYTYSKEFGYGLGNLWSNGLISSRAFHFGFPATLLALLLTIICIQRTDEKQFRKSLLCLALINGLLPLAHVHSCIPVSILIGFVLYDGYRKHFLVLRPAIECCLLNLFLWLPQFLYLSFASGNNLKAVHFHFGWIWPRDGSYYTEWLFRIFPLSVALFILAFAKNRNLTERIIGGVGVVLICIGSFFSLQVNPWDNQKVFFLAYLFSCVAAAILLLELLTSRYFLYILLASAILIMQILSGMTALSFLTKQHKLIPLKDFEIARLVDPLIPPHSPVVIRVDHTSFVQTIAGKTMYLGGYAESPNQKNRWLVYWGYQFNDRWERVDRLFRCRPGSVQALIDDGVEFILLSDRESIMHHQCPELRNLKTSFRDSGWTLFDLRPISRES